MKTFKLTPQMYSDDPLEAAEAYISAGRKVIVTHGMDADGSCTCSSQSCKAFKHPIVEFFPKGVHSATSDMSVVRRAFKKVPNANIAISLEGLTVVDIDGPEGADLIGPLDLPRTVRCKTSRGNHSYYAGELDGSFKIHQVDILTGQGRYVLVPPSIGTSGKQYVWSKIAAKKAAPLPPTITTLRTPTAPTAGTKTAKIREGGRNDGLFKTACGLRRQFDDATVLTIMRQINIVACEKPLDDAELERLVTSAGRYRETAEALFGPPVVRASLPQEFLWYPYIPRHGVTLLAGDPGRGKSLLVALLIALVTSGRPLPLTSEPATGYRVLLLSAEDNWARVSLARLEKAGFDIANLQMMHKFRALTDERIEALAAFMREWRPDLVVIDTLSAYMGGARDMHRQNEVGEFLGRLTELAEETGAAILGLAHLNKQGGESPLYRVVGSIGFMATIRSALFFGQDPENPDRLALAHGKANGSEEGPTVLFERVGGGRGNVPVLNAVGTSLATPGDVCRIEKGPVGRPRSEGDAAKDFVLEMLSDKPITWEKVQSAAERRAIASKSTMNLVRAELAREGKIAQIGRGKAATWALGENDRE